VNLFAAVLKQVLDLAAVFRIVEHVRDRPDHHLPPRAVGTLSRLRSAAAWSVTPAARWKKIRRTVSATSMFGTMPSSLSRW
jgi:hypothetical protein